MKRVAIITNVIPSYRLAFYQRLTKLENIEIKIYCQEQLKGVNLKLCHQEFTGHVELVPALGLPRERVAWQHLPVRKIIKENDLCIFYGNPRVFSNVVWSCLFRLGGHKIAIWGQAHTAGAGGMTEKIRLYWWKLFRNIFVYSEAEVEYLRDLGFKAPNIVGMNNGLDQKAIERTRSAWTEVLLSEWKIEKRIDGKKLILSCARLEAKNEFFRVIEVLPGVVARNPDVLWCVIGAGKEMDSLQHLARAKGVSDHILWLGELYEENELAPWFLSAQLMVHPSAIGLSLLHSFGYGLPVLTHDRSAFHMPEFSAMQDGETGFLYKEGDNSALQTKIIEALEIDDLSDMGYRALELVRTRYNVDYMVSQFCSFVNVSV